MHRPAYDDMKNLLAVIHQRMPGAVILEVVDTSSPHEEACGCMACKHGHEYDEEHDPDEPDDETGLVSAMTKEADDGEAGCGCSDSPAAPPTYEQLKAALRYQKS